MRYVYKKPSGKTATVNIDKVGGSREDFVKKHVGWWAKAHGTPESVMAEKLGAMWDIANPAKLKTEPKAEK